MTTRSTWQRVALVGGALLLASAGTVALGTPAHATDPGVHYVVTKIMAAEMSGSTPLTSTDADVSPNGKYLLVKREGDDLVYDLSTGARYGEIKSTPDWTYSGISVSDDGHVVGTAQDAATGQDFALYWSPGDPVALPNPTALIGQYLGGYCKDTTTFFAELYSMNDGTAYGKAGCDTNVERSVAVQWSVAQNFQLSGGDNAAHTLANATAAYALYGEDVLGSAGSTSNPLTWNLTENPGNPVALTDPADPSGQVEINYDRMLWKGRGEFLNGDDESTYYNGKDYPFPTGSANFIPVAFGEDGVLGGHVDSGDDAEVVIPHPDGSTTVSLLADVASFEASGYRPRAIIGSDDAGDFFGYMDDATGHRSWFKATQGEGTTPVTPAPTLTVTSPVNGHTYTRGTSYKVAFACKAGTGASLTECDGNLPNGYALNNLFAGTFTYTFTATQSDAQTVTKKVTFHVVNPPPTVTLTRPVNGHVYKKGTVVKASYACKAGAYTTLASCKGTVANGKKIATGTVGSHAFTVTATDKDGRKTTRTVHYTVKKK